MGIIFFHYCQIFFFGLQPGMILASVVLSVTAKGTILADMKLNSFGFMVQ